MHTRYLGSVIGSALRAKAPRQRLPEGQPVRQRLVGFRWPLAALCLALLVVCALPSAQIRLGASQLQGLVGSYTSLPGPLLAATAQTGAVGLQWNLVEGASGYNLYRSTTAGGEGTVPYLSNVGSAGYGMATFTDPPSGSLTNGTTYYYQVAPVQYGTVGAFSNEASATSGVAPLAAPTGLTVTADPTRIAITVSWASVSGATSYNLYRSGGSYYVPKLYRVGLTSTGFTDTDLLGGTTPGSYIANSTYFTYYVAAVDTDGQGTPSSTVSATVNGFYLTCPASVTVPRGSTVASNLVLTPLGTFAGNVLLSGNVAPAGIQGLFYPAASRVDTAWGYGTTGNIMVTAGPTTMPGSYPMTVTGTANGFIYSAGLTLIVQ